MYDFLSLVTSSFFFEFCSLISWHLKSLISATAFYSSAHKVTQFEASNCYIRNNDVQPGLWIFSDNPREGFIVPPFFIFLELAVLFRLQTLDLRNSHQLLSYRKIGEIQDLS